MQLDVGRGELIGLEAEVVDASNPYLKGIKGEIVDETKQTLRIQCDKMTKTIIKAQVTLKIRNEIVPGGVLVGRPEERIKLTAKKVNRLVKKHARKKTDKKSGNEHTFT